MVQCWLNIPQTAQNDATFRIDQSRHRYLQCHQGVCGNDPAGEPGCLKVRSDLLLERFSFNAGSLASTCIAL